MPELRKDPVVRRWVIIATERARRPGHFVTATKNVFIDTQDCPFCHNKESEIFSVKDENGNTRVKVVSSGTPALKADQPYNRHGHGIYDVINGYGVNEVVIESMDHISNMADFDLRQIQYVIRAYVARFHALAENPNLQYVFAYKNYGWAAGGRRIGHSRSQIIGSPVNPSRIKDKLTGAKRYYEYRERCIYCDLIRQEIKDKKRVIVETDHFVALTPFAPRFPFEVMIFPKEHHCDFAKGVFGKEEDLARIMKDLLLRFKIGLDDPAYNYVINTAPLRTPSKSRRWQSVEKDYHWHIELMPRLTQAAGFEKGTGFYICSIPPEDTAEFLREVKV